MGTGRIDIGSIRREQIVSAAVAVIAEQGIQNLSLSSIEEKTGMSRGRLTYYFRRMEDILLAVFDHLVQTMRKRVGATECAEFDHSSWPWIEYLLRMILTGPANPTFGPLQYTFLAQMSHRPDFRERLAGLYEEWRSNMGAGLALDLAKMETPPPFPPRALST